MRIPKQELKMVVDSQYNYDRRRYIFWAFNTTYFGIALFQIYSDINIEGGTNPQICIDTSIIESDLICPMNLYRLLVALIVTHLIQMLSSVIGYYGVDQKSRKLNKSYVYLIVASYICDLIISILLAFQYDNLNTTPFKNTKNEFLMLLILFPIIQGFVCYFCLNQFKKATQENFAMQLAKDNLLEAHPEISKDVIKMCLI